MNRNPVGRSSVRALVVDQVQTPSSGGHRGRRLGIRRACLISGVIAVSGLAVGTAVVVGRGQSPSPPMGCNFASTATSAQYSITPTQAQNAAIIAAVAMRKGMPDHAVTVALAASLQETQLRNLPYGDLDSSRPLPTAAVPGVGVQLPDHGPQLCRVGLLRPSGPSAWMADDGSHRGGPASPAQRDTRRLRQLGDRSALACHCAHGGGPRRALVSPRWLRWSGPPHLRRSRRRRRKRWGRNSWAYRSPPRPGGGWPRGPSPTPTTTTSTPSPLREGRGPWRRERGHRSRDPSPGLPRTRSMCPRRTTSFPRPVSAMTC